MKENPSNVILMCSKCGNKKRGHVLTPAELAQVVPGNWVKIVDNGEHFWVRVVSFDGLTVKGIVDNDLVFEHGFKCGDPISFSILEAYEVYSQAAEKRKER